MQLLRSKSNIINGERDKNVELEQRVGAKGIKQGKKLRCIEEIMSCFVSQLLGMHNFINFRRDDPSNVNMGRVLKRARARHSTQHQWKYNKLSIYQTTIGARGYKEVEESPFQGN